MMTGDLWLRPIRPAEVCLGRRIDPHYAPRRDQDTPCRPISHTTVMGTQPRWCWCNFAASKVLAYTCC